jgi:hypothetical protein
MTADNRITAHAVRAAHELALTAIVVGAVIQTAAADVRTGLAWARYGAVLVLEQPRLLGGELARVRALAGV